MIWISIFNAPTLLYIIGEKFWNIFYWGSFFPRRGSQWSIFPGNSIFASPLTNTFNIYFNSIQFLCCFIYQVWLLEERRFYLQLRLWNEGLFAARQIWNCWSTLCHLKAISFPFSLSAMWANYCSFEKLYCIKIWQPIQPNVVYKILNFNRHEFVHAGSPPKKGTYLSKKKNITYHDIDFLVV